MSKGWKMLSFHPFETDLRLLSACTDACSVAYFLMNFLPFRMFRPRCGMASRWPARL